MSSLRSEVLNELGAALAKAQSEMAAAGINSNNPFYKSKYASFASIVRASRPSLTKHGLAVIQRVVTFDDGTALLYTMLLHASGQSLESTAKIRPTKEDPQSFGSYISYLKRYTYAALVGVICDDEDDDAEDAMIPHRDSREEGRGGKGHPMGDDTISKDELNMLLMDLKNCPHDITQRILNRYGIQSLGEIRRREVGRVKEFIAASKKTLNID